MSQRFISIVGCAGSAGQRCLGPAAWCGVSMTQAHRAAARLLLCAVVAALSCGMPAGAQQTDLLCACPDVDWDIKPQASEVTQAIHAYNVDQVAEADLGKASALRALLPL